MQEKMRITTVVLSVAVLTALINFFVVVGQLAAEESIGEIIFSEDFADPTLPGWHGDRLTGVTFSRSGGPSGIPALTMEMREPVSSNLATELPVERIAGKAILLDVWRKAEKVETGAQEYYNAKSMLSWKASSDTKPNYVGTIYSDFSGSFEWQRHRYVVSMPEDLEQARVTIGMQACTGTASWAGLTVSVDPRFSNQRALENFLVREQHRAFADLDSDSVVIKRLRGGIIQVFAAHRYVPRKFWNETVRKAVLAEGANAAESRAAQSADLGGGFRVRLSRVLTDRAGKLEAGLPGLEGSARNDCVYEIASLRERVRQVRSDSLGERAVRLRAEAGSQAAVSPLIFGNNINTQSLSAPYDSSRSAFQNGFLERIRPMGITFLRYPGGCNADVFNWKDSIGPLEQRKDLINYHNGTSRGVARFGVDEYLRFCEQEGMVPLITTAFAKDRPDKVDLREHPTGIRHPYVFDYLKTAPERVQLAADWVEYCNGTVDTPYGKLRAENGHPKAYGVKYWEIGNESYGPDPTGSCKPEEYAAAFPAYVAAMKARDPSIQIVMNGSSHGTWNETVLRVAGKWADAFQFHIYLTPRVGDESRFEAQPQAATAGMRMADSVPGKIDAVETLMKKHLGRTLPVIISEFGMGNADKREFMTSVTSPVLVADIWRGLIESPLVLGANKWCLYSGYWFSQVEGPTLGRADAPYYNRPEQIMHTIYARCRSGARLAVDNETSQTVKAVVFDRVDSYGVVIISRESVSWQSLALDLPGAKSGDASCILLTAGHPTLGNENDHSLVAGYEFSFDYQPGQPILVPSNSVIGLILPQ